MITFLALLWLAALIAACGALIGDYFQRERRLTELRKELARKAADR